MKRVRPQIVVYDVVAKADVLVEVPGEWERLLWWPIARVVLRPNWTRHLLWRLAFSRRHPQRWAGWLVTHTPWWGGVGVLRPEIYARWYRSQG